MKLRLETGYNHRARPPVIARTRETEGVGDWEIKGMGRVTGE